MNDSCFRLKGSALTVVVLEIHHYREDQFAAEFEKTLSQAPHLFQRSPVVIDLEHCVAGKQDIELNGLLRQCRKFGLQPVGFRDCDEFREAMVETGLAVLPPLRNRAVRARAPQRAAPEAVAADGEGSPGASPPAPAPAPAPKSKIITQAVRSGQQVYARGTDLIVMSQVSAGAELLADGNIHVYGGLRGRALAGVNGNQDARVFCRSMEAELISVAGNFILSDELRERAWRVAAQAYLRDDTLCVEPL